MRAGLKMFTKQFIIAFLQDSDVIPDDTRNINQVMQTIVAFGCVEAILIGFVKIDYNWYSSDTLFVGGSVGVRAPRLTFDDSITQPALTRNTLHE
jgi:hypothetical protein